MKITMEANDGKVFYRTDDKFEALRKEVNAHNANLELKKQAELERQKKDEEEKKAKLVKEKESLELINNKAKELSELVKQHQINNKKSMMYRYDCDGNISVHESEQYMNGFSLVNAIDDKTIKRIEELMRQHIIYGRRIV